MYSTYFALPLIIYFSSISGLFLFHSFEQNMHLDICAKYQFIIIIGLTVCTKIDPFDDYLKFMMYVCIAIACYYNSRMKI